MLMLVEDLRRKIKDFLKTQEKFFLHTLGLVMCASFITPSYEHLSGH